MPDNTSSNSAPKLLDQVRGKVRLKHYSIRTEQAYLDWIKRFILHFDKQHPKNLGGDEVEKFLTYLAVEGKVAASTQKQARVPCCFSIAKFCKLNCPGWIMWHRPRHPSDYPLHLNGIVCVPIFSYSDAVFSVFTLWFSSRFSWA